MIIIIMPTKLPTKLPANTSIQSGMFDTIKVDISIASFNTWGVPPFRRALFTFACRVTSDLLEDPEDPFDSF